VSDAAAVAAVTIRQALIDATASLADAGCDTPRLDAELLLASVLEVGRSRLVLDRDDELDAVDAVGFADLVRRRADREPVAYILGVREFRRLSLRVDRRVLIPRPETELLVEVGLSLPHGARVVDVGTGSGAVALALADERPDLSVVGVDASEGAIAAARANAARLGLEVGFVVGDLLADVRECDAILANLPYVADGATLPTEIARYEPASALYGGPDGLDVIRRLVAAAGTRGSVPLVALEVGFDQADAVASLLADAGFGSVERLRDLAGHERVVVGRRARR
jgi:release factor glutamine methyltransferase